MIEKRFYLIGQDGDLGSFIRSGSDAVYSNDLRGIGSELMSEIPADLDSCIFGSVPGGDRGVAVTLDREAHEID